MRAILLTFSLVVLTLTPAMAYEEPKYTVLKTDGQIEIRRYAPMLSAAVTLDGDYKGIQNKAFMILADYIFGENVKPGTSNAQPIPMTTPVTIEPQSQDIPMTTPVTIEPAVKSDDPLGAKRWTMRFIMPSAYTMETLPKPKDERIVIEEIPGFDAVSSRFSMIFDAKDVTSHSAKIKAFAEKNGLNLIGQPYSAVYNGPFTLPFMRRNEVIWRIEEVKGKLSAESAQTE